MRKFWMQGSVFAFSTPWLRKQDNAYDKPEEPTCQLNIYPEPRLETGTLKILF